MNPSQRHVVTLEFLLEEEVTPDLFARKIAEACGEYYAIRPGEAVRAKGEEHEYRVGERKAVSILGAIARPVAIGKFKSPVGNRLDLRSFYSTHAYKLPTGTKFHRVIQYDENGPPIIKCLPMVINDLMSTALIECLPAKSKCGRCFP